MTLTQRMWIRVSLFAYMRWRGPGAVPPEGVPFHRDPSAVCPGYDPRPPKLGYWRDCETDGHYLCFSCCHRAPDGSYKALTP